MIRYLNMVNIATSRMPQKDYVYERVVWFECDFIIPIIIGLEMTDIEAFHRFINGEDGSELYRLLEDNEMYPNVMRFLYDGNTMDGDKDAYTESYNGLKEVYHYIFCDKREYKQQKAIGRILIRENEKEIIMDRVAMLLYMD